MRDRDERGKTQRPARAIFPGSVTPQLLAQGGDITNRAGEVWVFARDLGASLQEPRGDRGPGAVHAARNVACINEAHEG